ncbi:hypothetical protein [uncultured Azonexus sp.]|uniref:hypothetical protein n=1 Tax=uncultured Azonexus sp. TaxID=520307 RepID=UPI0026193C9C|nr:hypothetical protein [uncultured Azonexus sp.]
MADIPDDDLEKTRTALAPAMDAMAAILPWVGKSQPVRYPPELNKRWQTACKELADDWIKHGRTDPQTIRPRVFALLSVAIETGEADCLRFGETLASVADHLEHQPPGNRLSAALTATTEALLDEGGLENPHFGERLRHFTGRLETALRPSTKPGERSDVLDRLFVQDSEERLQRMHEALEVLPIDVYALELEAGELIQHAEQIEMWGIYHLARQLQNFALQLSDASETIQDQAAHDIAQQLALIESALRAIEY